MNIKHFNQLLLSMVLTIGCGACSDNLNTVLEPYGTEHRLMVEVESDDYKQGTLSLGASSQHIPINIECNTRWAVKVVDCDGGWCSVDVTEGIANGELTVSVRENMIASRMCTVEIYMTNAEGDKDVTDSQSIRIVQEASDLLVIPSSLEPFPPSYEKRTKFQVDSDIDWSMSVEYEGDIVTDFIRISPESSTMIETGEGVFEGSGDAVFYMDLQPNYTAAGRKAYLNFRSEVANYSIVVEQEKSSFTFDVTPLENQFVAADGGQIEFGILSLTNWDVSTAADWITFSPESSEASSERVRMIATVAPNSQGVARSASIHFRPSNESYAPLAVTVNQQGYDLTFGLGLDDDSHSVVKADGGIVNVELDSRFRWNAEAPSWMTVTPGEGDASKAIRDITVKVDVNETNDNRTGTVTFTPQPTEFTGGVTLNPVSLGIEPLKIPITQTGGRSAAVSVPWLKDGYTDKTATIEFNFYSPFYDIVEAGLEWGLADSSERQTIKVKPADPIDCTVSFDLTGLNGATKYVARGYVMDSRGTR
ncbi:MAG: hypothetical protein K2M16_04260, partial [Muribaculaceae bacterium]|nr:hypothetical protein [Muribaculaceae bacterium]